MAGACAEHHRTGRQVKKCVKVSNNGGQLTGTGNAKYKFGGKLCVLKSARVDVKGVHSGRVRDD